MKDLEQYESLDGKTTTWGVQPKEPIVAFRQGNGFWWVRGVGVMSADDFHARYEVISRIPE